MGGVMGMMPGHKDIQKVTTADLVKEMQPNGPQENRDELKKEYMATYKQL